MNPINCLIVDDEELARDLVENYANRLSYLNIVAKCADPLVAMQVMQEQKVDLIFLDIQMPNLTGIEFLKTLSNKPRIIFTTAYKEYALDGYELDVVDYLLKPFRFDRFLQAVNKVSELLRQDDVPATEVMLTAQSTVVMTEAEKDYILVKSDFKVFRIFHKEVIYIESMKEYVAYHTADKRTLSLGSLKKLEEELPSQFMRIHKSYIANTSYITALEGNMVHIQEHRLPIGASYKEAVLAKVF